MRKVLHDMEKVINNGGIRQVLSHHDRVGGVHVTAHRLDLRGFVLSHQ